VCGYSIVQALVVLKREVEKGSVTREGLVWSDLSKLFCTIICSGTKGES